MEAGAVGNIGIGYIALRDTTVGDYNVAVGNASGSLLTTGIGNTFIGGSSGFNSNGSNSVFLGRYAGKYETAGNKLFIDALDRTNEATARTSSLIYGVFNATPASQTLALNAQVSVLGGISATTGDFSSTVSVGAYTLPATDGTNGQVLVTNGSGVLTWTTL